MKAKVKILGTLLFFGASLMQSYAQMNSAPQWSIFQKFSNSNLKSAEQTVLNTDADWQRFYAKATGQQASMAPKFRDWVSQRLVVIAVGECPTPGFSVDVSTVFSERVGNTTIEWFKQSPPRNQRTGSGTSSPFIVIAIEKISARLSFRQVEAPVNQNNNYGGRPGWNNNNNQSQILPWSYHSSGVNSTMNQWGATCLATPEELAEYWARAQRGELPKDLRNFDWRSSVFIAIHLGNVYAGSSIGIDSIVVSPDYRVCINWYEKSPQVIRPAAGLESPYLLFEIPRYTTRPVFQKILGLPR